VYIPKYYRVDEPERVQQFLTQNPFGALVTHDGTRPVAVHVPFEWKEEGGRLRLYSHVARGNPIWRLAPDQGPVLVIFQGAHTYISPSWYQDPNVPTWNYAAVHVCGTCRLMSDAELEEFLIALVARYESGRPHARTWDTLPVDFREQQRRGVVGLVVDVTHIEAAAKMSQNRNDADYHHIVEELLDAPTHQDHAVAELMKKIRPELFEP